MIELDKDDVAPSFLKFYKYEEIKAKSNDLMTNKDKLRMKMHEKMKKLKQIQMEKGLKGSQYIISLDQIQKLRIMEEETLHTKTQRLNSRQVFHKDPEFTKA